MKIITLRLNDETEKKVKEYAEKNNEPLATYLRKAVEEWLKIEEYRKQKESDIVPPPQLIVNLDDQKKPELLAEYKRNLEFLTIETAILLRLIIEESGKFGKEEAIKLLAKAQQKTENYMKFYEVESEKNGKSE